MKHLYDRYITNGIEVLSWSSREEQRSQNGIPSVIASFPRDSAGPQTGITSVRLHVRQLQSIEAQLREDVGNLGDQGRQVNVENIFQKRI